jgi:hypothetical protein
MALVIRTTDSEIDYADGSAALRKLAARNVPSASQTRLRSLLTWMLVIGLVVLFMLFPGSPFGRRQHVVGISDFAPAAWVVAGVAVVIAGIRITTIAGWRAVRKERSARSSAIEIRADDNGIFADSDLQRMYYPWCFFTHFAESQKSFALHGRAINWGNSLLLVVPVAPLAKAGQVNSFRDLLARNILPEANRAKVGSAGFPVVMQEPEAPATAERAISHGLLGGETRAIVLDRVRFEHGDFTVTRLGWRRGLRWTRTAILIAAAFWGSIAFAIGAIGKAALTQPFWGVALLFPILVLYSALRTLVTSSTNLVGAKRGWPRHALNSGPITIALHDEGIAIATPDHELLLKPPSVVANLESPNAFSVVSRHWEIILPKRLLPDGRVVEVRQLLEAKFGPIQTLSHGETRRIIAPPES